MQKLNTTPNMKNTTASLVIAAIVAGCATGPSPEQQAQWAKERAESQAKQQQEEQQRRAAEDEKQKRTLQGRQELIQNKTASAPNAADIEKAKALFKTINALAGETLQQGEMVMATLPRTRKGPTISENPTPLFLFDETTGKLTLRLTPTNTREFLVGHLYQVDPWTFSGKRQVLQNEPIESNEFYVRLFTAETVRAATGENVQWESLVIVAAANKEKAEQIASVFKELVKLYSPK